MTHALYLPAIANEPDISEFGYYGGMTLPAYRFAVAWLGLLGERAKIMRMDERLVRCAAAHAEYLDSRTPDEIASLADFKGAMHFNHRTLNWSNRRARAAGYRLPEWHGDGNTVESCARDDREPAEVAVSLAHQDSHHDHMFGVGWYAGHTVYGVGVAGIDYVFIACPEEA